MVVCERVSDGRCVCEYKLECMCVCESISYMLYVRVIWECVCMWEFKWLYVWD